MRKTLTKVIIAVFGFVLFLVCSVKAQNALLWKICDDKSQNISYIYGTIHLKDKRVFTYTDTILSYLDSCDKLILELDLNPMNLFQYSDLMMLPADTTLHDLFKPDDLVVIKEVVKNITGMDFTTFEKLKPVVLLSFLMQYQLGGDMNFTLDEYLYHKGVEKSKEIIGLETVTEQFTLLETIPLDIIVDYLKNPGDEDEELELMICDYLESNIDELLHIMQKDETMISLKEEFLDDRNRKMADKIDELLNESRILVAVGAGHLPGEYGIINLLIQKEYDVEPVILEVPENLKCDRIWPD